MASEQDGKVVANRGSGAMSSDYGIRAGIAVERLVPGPNRDKAIARIFGVSDRMARYLRRGQHWTVERLNRASAAITGFDAYLASPDFHTRLDQIARELDEIRSGLRSEGDGE